MKPLFAALCGAVMATCADVCLGGVVVGYAPASGDLSSIDLARYTHINLAYAIPSANGTVSFQPSYNVKEFVDRIHSAGAKAMISVGGWSGSNHFSDIIKSPSERKQLVDSISDYIKVYNMDGAAIDWEFPGRPGNKCNKFDVDGDAGNLLEFSKQLRQSLDSSFVIAKKTIAFGVGVQPFAGPQGILQNLSQYAQSIDFINILAYDINGNWQPSTGPNAPLNFEPNKGAQFSFVSAAESWIKAGFPARQITMGVAFYGRSTVANANMAAEPASQYYPQQPAAPRGDSDDRLWVDECAGGPPAFSGLWSYRNLRAQGVLTAPESAAPPWKRYWDNIAQVPWLFNPDTKTFISYDDPASVAAKMKYVREKGMAGVAVWNIAMDYNNELLSAIQPKSETASSTTQPSQTAAHESSNSTLGGMSWPSAATTTAQVPSPASTLSSTLSSTVPSTVPSPLPSTLTAATTVATATATTAAQVNSTISATPAPQAPPAQSTTTAPAGAPPSGAPVAGGACGGQVSYKCMDADRADARFVVCIGGAWVQQKCGTGTKCVQNEKHIYCDWPQK